MTRGRGGSGAEVSVNQANNLSYSYYIRNTIVFFKRKVNKPACAKTKIKLQEKPCLIKSTNITNKNKTMSSFKSNENIH